MERINVDLNFGYLKREDIKCPVCGGKVNDFFSINSVGYANEIQLLAECWSGDADDHDHRHLFLVVIPVSNISRVDLVYSKQKKYAEKNNQRK